MAYYLLVRYNVNGGKIAENPYYYSTGMTSYTSYTASTTYKYFKATSTSANVTGCATSGGTYANFQNRYTASATSTLCNLTNVATFHITRDGYHVVDDAEYRTTSTGGNVISEEGSSATKNKPTISRLGGSTTANKTVTVYVNWVGNSYSVRFNASGGSGSMSDQTGFVFGTSKALSTNTFTRTGYTFAGWSKSSGSTTRVFYARDEGPFTGTLGTDGTYLYIRQGYQTYTYYRITTDGSDSYTSLGNTAPSGVSTWVADGASNTVTCGGNSYYKFEDGNDNHDWLYVYRVDGEQTVDYANGASMSDAAGAIPAADGTTIVNLYAVWTPNTYTVVANTNGGKFNNYSYGQTDSNGWTYQSSTTIQKPIVFNTLYGSLPAETPVNAGYTFNGWYTYASGGYQITPQTLKDDTITNIYAHWTDVAPVITILSTSVFSSNYYASVTFKIVDHSTITGYYVGPSNSPTSYHSVSSTGLETSSSITSSPAYIVAKDTAEHIAYVSLPIYKLTANANGGSTLDSTGWAKIDYSTSVKFIPYNAAYTVLPSVSIRSGYTFDGWYTAASGGIQVTTDTIMGSADTVIYAHWIETTPPSNLSITSTNNVAPSQTVTLSATDNVGITGYYWGTSSSTSVTYTDVTSTTSWSTTQTVSSGGLYYLRVKDAAGNTNYITKRFYKVYLEINEGASFSPSTVIIMEGNSFILPTPTLSSGYNVLNGYWVRVDNAYYSYGSTFTPTGTSNTIYLHTDGAISDVGKLPAVGVTITDENGSFSLTTNNSGIATISKSTLDTIWEDDGGTLSIRIQGTSVKPGYCMETVMYCGGNTGYHITRSTGYGVKVTIVNGNYQFYVYDLSSSAPKVYVKVNGTWKSAFAYVKVNGVWAPIPTVYVKQNGSWMQT